VRFMCFVFCAVVFLLPMSTVQAEDSAVVYIKAKAALKTKDVQTAYVLFRNLAEAGDAKAQAQLGRLYHAGLGVVSDWTVAAEWYRKAADQGNALGQFQLGQMYEIGRGDWGVNIGKGLDKDLKSAFEWFEKAAQQGMPAASIKLGLAYYNGQTVPQDYMKAYMHIGSAVRCYGKPANYSPGLVEMHRLLLTDIRPKLTPAQKMQIEQSEAFIDNIEKTYKSSSPATQKAIGLEDGFCGYPQSWE
jgi:TPR repeat protein